MIRVAMLSKWHVHADYYAEQAKKTGKVEITAVWDEDKERGQAWAERLGCDFEPCLDTLLARNDIDAVICDTPTTAHCDVLVKAAKAGKHIFTEKALCPTVAECLEVKKAVEEAGVTFAISFFQLGSPALKFAKRMIADGAFGTITHVRSRVAHGGVSDKWLPAYWFEEKDAAGGAMMDLGCHPMYIISYILGKPKRVTGLYTAPFGTPVDENAVAIAEFEGGAIGVAETSFISYGSPNTLELNGTEGCLIAHGDDIMVKSKKYKSLYKDFFKPDIPDADPIPLLQFIDAVDEGKPVSDEIGMEAAIALTELLENSYKGNASDVIVEL